MTPTTNLYGKYFWPKWFLRAQAFALECPESSPSVRSPAFWRHRLRVRAANPPPIRAAMTVAGGKWFELLGAGEFLLSVDLREVLRAACEGSGDIRAWALEGVCAARDYLAEGDLVLRHVLTRTASAAAGLEPQEIRLRTAHLQALLAAPGARLIRWAGALQRAVDPLSTDALIRGSPSGCVTVLPSLMEVPRNRLRCKEPAYPAPRQLRADDALSREAQWLLSCCSVLDGVQRDRGVILVNLPAYMSAARMLDRRVYGEERFVLPARGAPRTAWFEAGLEWSSILLNDTQGRWASRVNAYERAASIGWKLDLDIPTLALNAEAVELEVGGRRAPLPDLAVKTPSTRGHYAPVFVEYGDRKLAVIRKNIPKYGEERFFFELPSSPPPLPSVAPFVRIRLRGKEFWALTAIHKFADLGWSGGEDFVKFAMAAESRLKGVGFRLERSKQAIESRAEELRNENRALMGRLTPYEIQQVRGFLDGREPGPISPSFWDEVAAQMPGRTARGLKRAAREMMVVEAARMGWKDFRASSWWPGGDMARAIFARTGQLRAQR